MRSIILSASLLVACGGPQGGGGQRPLNAESMRGPAAGPAGRVLVITATCGSLEDMCRET